jgi:hypothetical protein
MNLARFSAGPTIGHLFDRGEARRRQRPRFGSVARGEAREDSDVDLLIGIVGPTSRWFPGGLLMHR